MNFTIWILQRIKRKVFGSGTWQWVEEYRRMIMREKILALLLTVLLGGIWFICASLVAVWLNDLERPPQYVMVGIFATPVVFFIYNWLAALYEIYNNERIATWQTLKE